jgi:hypothetical protein
MSDEQQQPKWTMEKIREEIYEARTKMFVIAKVLETSTMNFGEHPEWVMVIRPLLKEVVDNAQKISAVMDPD